MDGPNGDNPPLLLVRGLTKTYPGVRALDAVDWQVHEGEVRGLIGPNGAGKTTLVSIVAGMETPDSGQVHIAGRRLERFAPLAAAALGVALVPQRPSLFPSLSVLDNLFVAMWARRGPVLDWGQMSRRARQVFDRLGVDIPLGAPVGALSWADRQMVQIARALLHDARLFIFDEPTTPLTPAETERVFAVIQSLANAGAAVVYITHRLPELFDLCGSVTLLRDGRIISTVSISDVAEDDLVRMMAGPQPSLVSAAGGPLGRALLQVLDLHASGAGPVSFSVAEGEILGLTGLAGSGADAIARAIAGANRATGRVLLDGRPVPLNRVHLAQQAGICLLPADRHTESMFHGMTVRENLTITALRALAGRGGWIDSRREQQMAAQTAKRMAVKLASIEQPIETLSGGNQQKVALGRSLLAQPRVLVAIEPTQGVDVGARAEIHQLLRSLAAQGMAVIVVASEVAELQRLCHRVLVFHRGRLAGSLPAHQATEEQVLRHASGLSQAQASLPSAAASPVPDQPPALAFPFVREAVLAAFLVLLALVVGAANPQFLSASNLRDVAGNASYVLVAALAMTILIVTGNIDISVGSALGLCAAVGAGMAVAGRPLAEVILITALCGCVLGLVNALATVGLRLASIIVTLGTLNIFRGLLIQFTGGKWITGLPSHFRIIALGTIAGIPLCVLIALAAACLTWLALRFTAWGRCCYLWGDNPDAASRLGINGNLVVVSAFALMGAATGLAALMFAARFSAVQSNAGLGFELLVITCAVVGGANIFGGRATVIGTVLGVLLVTVLGNALTLVHLSAYWDRAAQGALVLAAVSGDVLAYRRRSR